MSPVFRDLSDGLWARLDRSAAFDRAFDLPGRSHRARRAARAAVVAAADGQERAGQRLVAQTLRGAAAGMAAGGWSAALLGLLSIAAIGRGATSQTGTGKFSELAGQGLLGGTLVDLGRGLIVAGYVAGAALGGAAGVLVCPLAPLLGARMATPCAWGATRGGAGLALVLDWCLARPIALTLMVLRLPDAIDAALSCALGAAVGGASGALAGTVAEGRAWARATLQPPATAATLPDSPPTALAAAATPP